MSGRLRALGRLWPRGLTGQMILLLLLALVLAQATSFVILMDERRLAVRAAERVQVLARTASVVRLLEGTPPALHDQILRGASSAGLRFWLAPRSEVDPAAAQPDDNPLRHRLETLLAGTAAGAVLVDLRDGDDSWLSWPGTRGRGQWRAGAANPESDPETDGQGDRESDPESDEGDHGRSGHGHRHPPRLSLVLSVGLDDGRWLNAATRVPGPTPSWALPSLISMLLMAIAVCLIVAFMVRRITRPLARLAGAAERLGRGESVDPLPEQGPADIRQTTRAFNRMQARLQRFVQDRTRMLAAISHDLRTPITTLRLRAEFIDDQETQARILATLDEMQRMTEATLEFAREEAAREDSRTVDLAALIDSLCADLVDLGQEVSFAPAERAPYPCRPVGLKRALRNLVENAVAYGGRARVALRVGAGGPEIVVDDDGPGIAAADVERVFSPFVRLEESRSPETGGIGLGMAIARSTIRGHGGDVRLANRPEGGLRVTIQLPAADRG